MTGSIAQVIITALVAALGGAGIWQLFKIRAEGRRLDAEARKVGAQERDIFVKTAVAFIEPVQQQYTQVWGQLEKSQEAALQLRERIAVLEDKVIKLREDMAEERAKYREQIDYLKQELKNREQVIALLRAQLGPNSSIS